MFKCYQRPLLQEGLDGVCIHKSTNKGMLGPATFTERVDLEEVQRAVPHMQNRVRVRTDSFDANLHCAAREAP
jgi:hypothetical protein